MSNIPGLIQPTVNSYPPGANSPATAAKLINDANNIKLQNINQMAAGSRRRRKMGGGDLVAVPIIKSICLLDIIFSIRKTAISHSCRTGFNSNLDSHNFDYTRKCIGTANCDGGYFGPSESTFRNVMMHSV